MLSLLEKLTEIYLLSNQTLYMEVGMAKFKPIVLPFIYFSLFLAAKILQFFFLYAYFFKGNFGLPNFCQFFFSIIRDVAKFLLFLLPILLF